MQAKPAKGEPKPIKRQKVPEKSLVFRVLRGLHEILIIRLIAYAHAPRLMDMLRDKWQEG
jgi:hypothetical protein